jgi:hypothetical protein
MTGTLLWCLIRMCFEVKCVDVAPFAGRCITGPNQVSIIVQITDTCPGARLPAFRSTIIACMPSCMLSIAPQH